MPRVQQSQKIELVPKHRIQPHPENPRKGDNESIAESVEHNKFYGACLVQRSTGYIVAGSHRYRAAVDKGMTEIPTIYLDINDEEARRIMLADNRTADLAINDAETVTALLTDLADNDVNGLLGTGYSATDLAEFTRANFTEESTRPEREPSEAEQSVPVRVGAYHFNIPKSKFDAWLEGVRSKVGFTPEAQRAELLRLLKIKGK